MKGKSIGFTVLARTSWFCMGLAMLAQTPPPYQRHNVPITPEEQAAIDAGRKGAKPRSIASRGSLDGIESMRAKVFKTVEPSVVYISSSTQLIKNALVDSVTSNVLAVWDLPPGTGTGFVWDDQGHVVTNHHVIEVEVSGAALTEAEDLRVTLSDGKAYKARVIGQSLYYDIAVLRVFAPLKDMKPLNLGTSKGLMVGQSVLAIGNPFGLDHTMTTGIISGLGRDVSTDAQLGRRIHGAIQTDAAINPGNSGGPLLDSAGRLIGMNTAIKSTSGASAGIGFAIPVDTLNRVVPVLIAKGQMDRPVLGFSTVQDLDVQRLGFPKGAVISGVEPNGMADRAGLRPCQINPDGESITLGDVIVGFHGKTIENAIQLFDLLELVPPDEPLVFDVLRGGKRIEITLRPDLAKEAPQKPQPKQEKPGPLA